MYNVHIIKEKHMQERQCIYKYFGKFTRTMDACAFNNKSVVKNYVFKIENIFPRNIRKKKKKNVRI